MADFTSVIRRAVEGLPDNTPELRARVYDKARTAVIRQMDNMNPKPPEALVKRQIDKIDAAIAEVESEFAEALPQDEEDAFTEALPVSAPPEPEEAFDEEPVGHRPVEEDEPPAAEPEPPHETRSGGYEGYVQHVAEPYSDEEAEEPEPAAPAYEDRAPAQPYYEDEPLPADDDEPDYGEASQAAGDDGYVDDDGYDEADDGREPEDPAFEDDYGQLRGAQFEVVRATPQPEPESGFGDRDDTGSIDDDVLDWQHSSAGLPNEAITPAPPPPRRPVPEKDWAHVDSLLGLEPEADEDGFDDYETGLDDDEKDNRRQPEKPARRRLVPLIAGIVALVVIGAGGYFAWSNIDAVRSLVAGSSADPEPTETAPETADSTAQSPADDGTEVAETDEKPFTQRLLPDGKEVDEGLPAADASTGPARTVAAQTSGGSDVAETAGQETAEPAPPVGAAQKMYLYEEQLGQSVPSAYQGTVEWSLKQENTGTSVSEPVIEGTLRVPEVGLTGTITFRRNDDSSLPASHLIDISFELGDNFDGGAIDNVQRLSMKSTEAARGDPLIAVSAKITDNLYMLALNDFDQARAQNMTLLRDRNWIDIPITYRNGRRALLTLEKGTTGMAIFDRAIQEWQALGDIGSN